MSGRDETLSDPRTGPGQVLAGTRTLTEVALTDDCKENMASFTVPRLLEFGSGLPRTTTSQCQKYKLKAHAEKRRAAACGRGTAAIVVKR